MRLQHVASQQLRRILRRYPFLRRLSITTTLLTALWIYTLYWGERSVYRDGIEQCAWTRWEDWPKEAEPHHLVFIADPQLVDPHTYPGRPWPLSSLTEGYTDLYMARNFLLINRRIDPDTIIFLGDLFDGGREWAPDTPKPLRRNQRKRLQDLGILEGDAEHNLRPGGQGVKEFSPGENGRWSKWSHKQWVKEFDRFGRIFFTPSQLYPEPERIAFPSFDVPTHPINLENGADDRTWREYATAAGKPRRVITSLPGNHDLGLGPGVQIAIRDRFQSHFGEGNRMDIIANHTFLSLDTPSMSAGSFYQNSGYETEPDAVQEWRHIWKQGFDFIRDLRRPAGKLVTHALSEYFPGEAPSRKRWPQEITEPSTQLQQPSLSELAEDAMKFQPQLPVILLSHIPLFRNPDTECGKLRERGHAIPVQMGYQYQNVLTHSLSKELVTKASAAGDIVAIFSGDDHDYCDVIHRYNIPVWSDEPAPGDDNLKAILKHVREITVKSFSWAMGVRKPGFLMVSLWNPVDSRGKTIGTPLPTLQTNLCLLPDQLNIFITYGLLFLFTLPVLLVRAIFLSFQTHQHESSGDFDSDSHNPLSPVRNMALPRFRSKSNATLANGHSYPVAKSTSDTHGRQRGMSTTSSHSRNNSSTVYLGVQRSYNARTRSVSPAVGAGSGVGINSHPMNGGGGLIEKAGYFPPVKWTDPEEDESDEETYVGVDVAEDDSQAKWKWRRRSQNRARKVLDELGASLLVVGTPAVLYYFFLIKNG